MKHFLETLYACLWAYSLIEIGEYAYGKIRKRKNFKKEVHEDLEKIANS